MGSTGRGVAEDRGEGSDVGLERRWFPVCRGEEAAAHHIVHTALLGQELAVWRADDGTVNAWENRCPHRGVRLSVGTNLGKALKCRYHGWTYESGSGGCIERPAHPGEKPPALVRARAYSCAEHQGHVWVRLSGEDEDQDPVLPAPAGPAPPALTLRSVHVRAPAAAVAESIARHRAPARGARNGSPVEVVDSYTLRTVDGQAGAIRYSLQPVSKAETVIHGVLAEAPPQAERLTVLRCENERLRAVRDAAEALVPP